MKHLKVIVLSFGLGFLGRNQPNNCNTTEHFLELSRTTQVFLWYLFVQVWTLLLLKEIIKGRVVTFKLQLKWGIWSISRRQIQESSYEGSWEIGLPLCLRANLRLGMLFHCVPW